MPEEKMNRTDQNMRFYVQVQNTPKDAQKPFSNGRFNGTDVNPMYRIKMLTMMFGPVGQGWWTEDEQYTMVPCEATGEVAVFCTLKLFYRDPDTHEISKGVSGVGGNKFLVSQKSGKYCNDEAYKMAYTDAVSIACKALGFSHDIYYQNDRTNYTMYNDNQPDQQGTQQAVNIHSASSVELIDKIAKRLDVIGSDMKTTEKTAFAKKTIVPIIGSMNYKTCTDIDKLQKLLDELNKDNTQNKAA